MGINNENNNKKYDNFTLEKDIINKNLNNDND
jgi:hypothetical protein